MPTLLENGAKLRSKIDEKARRFRNLRFIGFCREYNVKIVFCGNAANAEKEALAIMRKIYEYHGQPKTDI